MDYDQYVDGRGAPDAGGFDGCARAHRRGAPGWAADHRGDQADAGGRARGLLADKPPQAPSPTRIVCA